eukprot:m.154113 g.154113  ORF g.154113 m.154113 type:complete len:604 (-) comp30870_c0_seq1:273-2084(-)
MAETMLSYGNELNGLGNSTAGSGHILSVLDYIVVGSYVVFSVAVGVLGSRGAGKSGSNYFLAGKGANKWVTGISLVSGLTSGISFLGIPGFTCVHGIAMLSFVLGYFLSAPFILWVAIPFFTRPELNFTTCYSYLEIRFSRPVRIVAATSFLVRVMIYMGFVLFAPALALQAVAQVKVGYTILICGTLATAYTCKGGMSAVIWTDFVASIALIAGVCVALAFSVSRVGAENVWEIASHKNASDGDRYLTPTEFWDFAPLASVNFWSMALGFAFNTAAQTGTDQIAVQRYLATANASTARTTAYFAIFGNTVMLLFLTFLGMSLAVYYDVDYGVAQLPDRINKNKDQIFPYFFTNELPNGLAGLIIAALFATTMSVFSGGINAAVTCFITDILKSSSTKSKIPFGMSTVGFAKALTIVCGIFAMVVAYIAQYISQGLSLITSVAQSICCAPTFGMFLLGMLSQRTDSKDALIGFVASLLSLIYCLAGTFICPNSDNSDGKSSKQMGLPAVCETIFKPARISEWVYPLVGTVVCVGVGLISSVARGSHSPPAAKVIGLTWQTRKFRPLPESRLDEDEDEDGSLPHGGDGDEPPAYKPTVTSPLLN